MRARRNERCGSSLRGLAAAAAILALCAACGSSTENQDHSEAGTYHLTSVNGQTLPVTITGTSLGTVVIQSATVTLNAGGTPSYTASISGTVNGAGPSAFLSDAGTYSRSGSSLTFNSGSAPLPYTGTYDSSTGQITVALPGIVIGISQQLLLTLVKS